MNSYDTDHNRIKPTSKIIQKPTFKIIWKPIKVLQKADQNHIPIDQYRIKNNRNRIRIEQNHMKTNQNRIRTDQNHIQGMLNLIEVKIAVALYKEDIKQDIKAYKEQDFVAPQWVKEALHEDEGAASNSGQRFPA